MSSAAPNPPSTLSKAKTKSKQRYLKAKKDRRKKRKTGTAVHPSVTPVEGPQHALNTVVDSDGSEDGNEQLEPYDSVSEADEPTTVVVEAPKIEPQRLRKRRKLDPSDSSTVPVVQMTEVQDTDTNHASTASMHVVTRPTSPAPLASLPAFPEPSRPDAPSKYTLAMQGLDRAIAEAHIVEATESLPLPSMSELDGKLGLSERTCKRLNELGISELFAVQTAVIPFILSNSDQKSLYLPYHTPRDVCVSAPTGSGKTLAYVLPIVELLSSRIVTRLRALVVLPTRDLVIQVRETFEAVAKGRGLKIGTATGQHSYAHEQAQLVADRSFSLQGGSSKIDILICTPGRLMDHLNGTPNFSLQHLRFLVIDEADRLLAQSFQDWLAKVLSATRLPTEAPPKSLAGLDPVSLGSGFPRPDALSPAFLPLLHDIPIIRTDLDETREPSCQKLLFSATLTRDPAKLAALGLANPKYFVVKGQSEKVPNPEDGVLDLVMEKFNMPTGLTEHMVVVESSQKPLILFHLVHNLGVTNAIVFTKSAESTIRLVRLFEFFELAYTTDSGSSIRDKIVAHAYSSDLAAGERKTILEKFKNQEIHLLVCSDLISRGIDISHVSHVVSYDAPVDMRKYVHRVGRTARAGRSGDAWSLIEEQEARYFKSMMKVADHLEKVKRLRITPKEVEPLVPYYERALSQLKDVYSRANL